MILVSLQYLIRVLIYNNKFSSVHQDGNWQNIFYLSVVKEPVHHGYLHPPPHPPHHPHPKNMRWLMQRFAEHTSLQGIPFIKRAGRTYSKAIWTILFIFAVVATIIQLYMVGFSIIQLYMVRIAIMEGITIVQLYVACLMCHVSCTTT